MIASRLCTGSALPYIMGTYVYLLYLCMNNICMPYATITKADCSNCGVFFIPKGAVNHCIVLYSIAHVRHWIVMNLINCIVSWFISDPLLIMTHTHTKPFPTNVWLISIHWNASMCCYPLDATPTPCTPFANVHARVRTRQFMNKCAHIKPSKTSSNMRALKKTPYTRTDGTHVIKTATEIHMHGS